jgi:predicted DsbA family dithiol-disulfide isomerase
LQREYAVEVEFAPFLLDPTTPPEGKPRRPQTQASDGPTPIEARGASLGIRFSRGRTWSSNSHLALEAAEFAAGQGRAMEFHRAMFKAYFDDLEEIGAIETIVRVGEGVGLDPEGLRESLEGGQYRKLVDEGIRWSREMGVSGVPTFVFDEKYGVVGAQDYSVLESMMEKLGHQRRG